MAISIAPTPWLCRVRTLKDLDKSALALAEVCNLLLNESTQDELLRSVIFARMSREKLAASITTVHELARPYDDNFQDEMVEAKALVLWNTIYMQAALDHLRQ